MHSGSAKKDAEIEPAAPTSVEDYLARLPADVRDALQYVRELVKAIAPDVAERIAYGVIVFKLKHDLVGMASQKKHCSFYTMNPALVRSMAEGLKGYRVSGATIHFTPQEPLPDRLIAHILRLRMEEMAGRD
jgi:uncharacterized protein YdhG (YjbR/CyaY superfamily)